MDVVIRYRDRVREDTLLPKVNWRSTHNPSSYHDGRVALDGISRGGNAAAQG